MIKICIFLSKLQVPTEVCDGKRPYIHCDPYVDEVKEKVPREVCTPECKNIAKLVCEEEPVGEKCRTVTTPMEYEVPVEKCQEEEVEESSFFGFLS